MVNQELIDTLCKELDAADTVGKSHTVAIKAIRLLQDQLAKPKTDSWEGEVDRQSGAYTDEEIRNSTEWK